MVHYRTFRNTDPPHLTQIWNEVFAGNGGVALTNNSALEHYVFAKPYFDPAGLIIAEEDTECLGFCHGGFGPDAAGARLSTQTGVVCVVGVRSARRRQGIGSQLLRLCEAYLRERGASTIVAGPHPPLTPFYHGLYGGCQPPGFLEIHAEAAPFLANYGYQLDKEVSIFRRRVADPIRWSDPRQTARLSQFEMRVSACKRLGGWWQECVWNPIEPLEFALFSKAGEAVASALVWDMGADGGSEGGQNGSVVGIQDFTVREALRRQGMGRLFLALLFRVLHEQYFEAVEMHAEQDNLAGREFCRRLGFNLAGQGRVYRKR